MVNRDNYLVAKEYLATARPTSKKFDEATKERYWSAIRHALIWADERYLYDAIQGQEEEFLEYVDSLPARRGEGGLSDEGKKKIILQCKSLLVWANRKQLPGYDALGLADVDLLVAPRIRKRDVDPVSVSLDEALYLCTSRSLRSENLALWQGQATMAFKFLSGARRTAVATAQIQAIALSEMVFKQLAGFGVVTKNDKEAVTTLLPIQPLLDVVAEWDEFVRSQLPVTARWFAPFNNSWGDLSLSSKAPGDHRDEALAKTFRDVYKAMGMADHYKNPHAFRHGHAVYCIERSRTMADIQALSQNLMHDDIKTTTGIYTMIERKARHAIIMKFLPEYKGSPDGELRAYLSGLARGDLRKAINIAADLLME